jgi:hypothetical protein
MLFPSKYVKNLIFMPFEKNSHENKEVTKTFHENIDVMENFQALGGYFPWMIAFA